MKNIDPDKNKTKHNFISAWETNNAYRTLKCNLFCDIAINNIIINNYQIQVKNLIWNAKKIEELINKC